MPEMPLRAAGRFRNARQKPQALKSRCALLAADSAPPTVILSGAKNLALPS